MQRVLGEESACHGVDGEPLGSLPKPRGICLNNRTLWHIRDLPHLLLLLLFSLNVKLCKEFYHGYLPTYRLSYGGNYDMGSSFFFSF